MQFVDKDLKSIQEARILVESARDAHFLLKEYSQDDLDRVVKKLINDILTVIPELVDFELAETKAGSKTDKLQLIDSFMKRFSTEIEQQTVIGILQRNSEDQIETIGVSLGVAAVILPPENVVLNSLFTTLIAIKSGNAVILVPQPRRETVVAKVYTKLALAATEAGLPQGTISYMESTADQGVHEIMSHPDTAIVINIGSPKYFDTPQTGNTPMIYGGTGSTPVFIERTANIAQAAEAVVNSRAFDNGLLPAAEQFIIAEAVIAKAVKELMIKAGAYFMTVEEEQSLLASLFLDKQQVNPAFIGQSACWLASKAGFSVPAQTKVLVSEQPYIFDENPFTNELKCPILTFYLESDWIHACEKCIELLNEKRNGHTLAIHSNNQQIISEFALKKPVGRMIVNASASFSSIGLDSTLPLSLILGGLTTGRGFLSKNIVASDLTYQRTIGYRKNQVGNQKNLQEDILTDQALLEKFLRKIMEQ